MFFLRLIEKDAPGAQQAFDQALTIARRNEDELLEARILAAWGNVDLFHNYPDESLEKAFKVIGVAQANADLRLELNARLDAARLLTAQGDSESAKQQSAACLELAEKLRDRLRLTLANRANTTLFRLLGDWPRARDFSDRGLAVAPEDVSLLGERVVLEYDLGAGPGLFGKICGDDARQRTIKSGNSVFWSGSGLALHRTAYRIR